MKLQFEIQDKSGAKRSLFWVAAITVALAGVTSVNYLSPGMYTSITADLAASTAPKLQTPEIAARIVAPQPSAAVAAGPNEDQVTPLVRFKKPITIGPITAGQEDPNCANSEDNSPKSAAQMAAGAKPYALASEPKQVAVVPVRPALVVPQQGAKVEQKTVVEAQIKAPIVAAAKTVSTEKFSVIGATEKNVTIDIGGVIRTISMNEALPNGAIFMGYDGKQIKTNLGVYLIN